MANNVNLLENWKKECYLLSSPLSLEMKLKREDINFIYKILNDYFGQDFFILKKINPDLLSDPNWIHFLLVNYEKTACVFALLEIANILLYLKGLSKSIQKKFKSLIADPRQFRDMFFELYLFRLFDYNNIENFKTAKEGEKALDIVCTINDQEFLCECRKIYNPEFQSIKRKIGVLENIVLQFQKLNTCVGLIGTIKFAHPVYKGINEIYREKLLNFINELQKSNYRSIEYEDIDKYGELVIKNYSIINNIEVDKNSSDFDIIFKIIPPFSIIPNARNNFRIQIGGNNFIPQWKINRKLFTILEDKKKQHVNSKYIDKIYFIDNESIPDFDFPIFKIAAMFEEDKFMEFVQDNFSEREIICFIKREYMGDLPKVEIKVFGNNIDPSVKLRLENLKTDFDYYNIK